MAVVETSPAVVNVHFRRELAHVVNAENVLAGRVARVAVVLPALGHPGWVLGAVPAVLPVAALALAPVAAARPPTARAVTVTHGPHSLR